MKVGLIIVYVVFFLCSCRYSVETELPIEEDKVISLLADLRFAEESIDYYKESVDSIHAVLLDSIYSIHNVDSTFVKNLIEILEKDITQYYILEKKAHKQLKEYLDDSESK